VAITVKRERPDQRRHHRVTAPLYINVDGSAEKFKARDWSLGGVCIDGYTGVLPEAGGTVALHLTLPFQGFDIGFDVDARVVRVNPEIKSVAVEYTNLGQRETELLKHFIDDLVRGVMSPVEDSIQRIDMPITPVSTEPDPKPKNAIESNRMPVRQLAWVGIYAAMGFVVFGYTALVLYSNFFRMEVQTAVVAAPTVSVPARGDGELPYVRVSAGDMVKEGETVIYFTDYNLEREIDTAKIEIQEKEAALNSLLMKRASELETMTEYATLELQGIAQSKVGLDALEAEARAATERAARLKTLLKDGLTTRPRVEDANQWLAEAQAKLDVKRLEFKEQMRRAESGLGQRFFNGREFVGANGEIEADIKLARYHISLANQAHEALLRHRERLAVKAPFNGRVLEVPVPRNASVKRGDIIAVFEKDDERYISAFLTQDEVIKVSKGEQASVYFPALNASLRADVVSVDRTSGFKEEISRRFSWRGAEDRSAEVRLELAADNEKALLDQVTPGLPAVVLFEAQSTNPILAAVWRKIGSLFL
jgi:multidrug resistance efflux pump